MHTCPEPDPMASAAACGTTSDGRHYRYSSAHNGYIFDGPETDPNVPPTPIIPGPHEDGCLYHYAPSRETVVTDLTTGQPAYAVRGGVARVLTGLSPAQERYYSATHGGDWPEDH